jgi:hypothetical protein
MTTTMHASRSTALPAPLSAAARSTHLRLVQPGEVPGGRPVRRAVGARPALRLTSRGRAVLRALVVLVLAALLAATALIMARGADAADGPAPAVVVRHHVVLPGETLWGIATKLAPRADPRDAIASIVEFNALPSSAIHAGQDLAIPPQLVQR